jgi:hypothetical protein
MFKIILVLVIYLQFEFSLCKGPICIQSETHRKTPEKIEDLHHLVIIYIDLSRFYFFFYNLKENFLVQWLVLSIML